MVGLQPIETKEFQEKGLAGSPNPRSKCAEKTTNSPFLGFGEISPSGGARAPTSPVLPKNRFRRSFQMNASSTVELIHAPELAMEDLFPVEGEANARTARTRERIDKHRGAQEVAREDESGMGNGNPGRSPLFPL